MPMSSKSASAGGGFGRIAFRSYFGSRIDAHRLGKSAHWAPRPMAHAVHYLSHDRPRYSGLLTKSSPSQSGKS